MTAQNRGGFFSGRRRLLLFAVVIAPTIGFFAGAGDWLRGYAIYRGHLGVTGRIAGQSFDLPREALRCAGCHESAAPELAGAGALSLDLRMLGAPRSRRGGPPTAYTLESFCLTLRNGIDPAAVILSRIMPRFDVSDAECRALWTYLAA